MSIFFVDNICFEVSVEDIFCQTWSLACYQLAHFLQLVLIVGNSISCEVLLEDILLQIIKILPIEGNGCQYCVLTELLLCSNIWKWFSLSRNEKMSSQPHCCVVVLWYYKNCTPGFNFQFLVRGMQSLGQNRQLKPFDDRLPSVRSN